MVIPFAVMNDLGIFMNYMNMNFHFLSV